MKKYAVILFCLLPAVMLQAQNLNPTVEVTNDYRGAVGSFDKKSIPMAVPDTLLQFRHDFDYLTFDNPYKGSYEFKPYSVELVPEPGSYGDKRLLLVLGAGYTLHPVANAVYSPKLKNGLQLSLWQDFSGYYGQYRGYDGKGYDLSERAGVEIRYPWGKSELKASASYDGIFRSVQNIGAGSFNSALASLSLYSRNPAEKAFVYNFNLDYRYSHFCLGEKYGEHDVRLYGTVSPAFAKGFRMPIDFIGEYDSLYSSFDIEGAPHFRLTLGPVDINAGARFAFFRDGFINNIKFRIFPDVVAKVDAVKGYLSIYAGAGGGPKYHSSSCLIHKNHFFSTRYETFDICDFDFYGGFRGSAGSNFEYDLRGGYSINSSYTLDSVISSKSGFSSAGGNLVHADLNLMWRSQSVDAEGGLHLRHFLAHSALPGFVPPLLSGSIRGRYNYLKRVFAGVYVEGAMARTYDTYTMPGFVDLGVFAEYRFTPAFGLWIQGSNLLNMEIQRVPLYSERGINFTAGLRINL
ncbi:MAG: hypothetical protein IJU69_02105 [Bacteroidales bacterium]|nr:hypothetical protein [Bacteroidales bacterium]